MSAPVAPRRSTLRRFGAACLCLCGLAAVPAWANGDGSREPAPSATVQDAAAATPQPGRSLEDAVASVVVVALTEQFDGKPISVNIDSFDVQVTGARERLVSGRGSVVVAGSVESIAFGYRSVYDVRTANAGYPAISIGRIGAGVERAVPNDAALVGELDQRVASTLSGELGGKQVWLQLDSIESFETGGRYVRIDAAGIADFGPDGSTPARVEALYDRQRQTWLRVNYQLGQAPAGGGLLSGGSPL